MTEKVSKRQKHWHLNITDFSYVAETYEVVHESNRTIWENVATGNCVLQLWLMTEPSEVHRVQPISDQHSAMLMTLKYLI